MGFRILINKELYLISGGMLLSIVIQRLFKVCNGILFSRTWHWKRLFHRHRIGREPSAQYKYGQAMSIVKDPLSFEGELSRETTDKIVCSQYGFLPEQRHDNAVQHETNDLATMTSIPKESTFVGRIGILAERYCPALRDFSGESGQTTALEIGCLTGGVSFELARSFQAVYACDSSKECINIARIMQERGWSRYNMLLEGDIYEEKTAIVDASIDRDRVSFGHIAFDDIYKRSKAFLFKCSFDCVVALCLTRMTDPKMLLERLINFVNPHGICILGSAFEWSVDTTPPDKWLGGYRGQDGTTVSNMRTIRSLMEKEFELIHVEDLPFIIRESSRREFVMKYCISVWKRQQ